MSLKIKAVKSIGIVWSLGVVNIIMQFTTSIVLARLLFPEDFAIIGLAGFVLGFIRQFQNFGFGQEIIRRQKRVEDALYTAFLMRFGLAIILFFIALVIAPFGAEFFDESALTAVIYILSFTIVLDSFVFIPDVMLTKELMFKRQAIPKISTGITYAVVTISLAFFGFSYWSIVWGTLASSLVGIAVYYSVFPWKLEYRFDKELAKEILSFGIWIFIAAILTFAALNFDNAIVGKLAGLTALGYYFIAFKFGRLAVTYISGAVVSVMFPILSKLKEDIPRLKRGFLLTMRYLSVLTVPVSLGTLALAPIFVPTVLGERWNSAIFPMQLLCVHGLLGALSHPIGSMYLVFAKTKLSAKISIVTVPSKIFILALLTVWYGIIGAAIATVVMGFIHVSASFFFSRKFMNVKTKELLSEVGIPIVSGIIMAFILIFIQFFFDIEKNLINLGILGIVSLCLYFGMLYLLSRGRLVKDFVKILKLIRK